MDHTPTPWAIGYGGMAGDDFAIITSKFAEYPICHLEPRGYLKANAGHIVRCVNAHDYLVAALEKLCADCDGDALGTVKAPSWAVLCSATAALAKAKGE